MGNSVQEETEKSLSVPPVLGDFGGAGNVQADDL